MFPPSFAPLPPLTALPAAHTPRTPAACPSHAIRPLLEHPAGSVHFIYLILSILHPATNYCSISRRPCIYVHYASSARVRTSQATVRNRTRPCNRVRKKKRQKFFRYLTTIPRSGTTAAAVRIVRKGRSAQRLRPWAIGMFCFPEVRFDQSAKQFFGNVRKEDWFFRLKINVLIPSVVRRGEWNNYNGRASIVFLIKNIFNYIIGFPKSRVTRSTIAAA